MFTVLLLCLLFIYGCNPTEMGTEGQERIHMSSSTNATPLSLRVRLSGASVQLSVHRTIQPEIRQTSTCANHTQPHHKAHQTSTHPRNPTPPPNEAEGYRADPTRRPARLALRRVTQQGVILYT
jgi:hypothetical protein